MVMNSYEKDAIERLRPYLPECAVLLKSDGSFPLEGPCRIGAYGSGVRHTIKGGTGSGEVNSRYFVTIEEGLEKAGFTIINKDWLDGYDEVLVKAKADFIKEIKLRAKQKHTMAIMEGMGAVMKEPEHDLKISQEGGVGIYVVSRICGEGNDRTFDKGDFRLNDSELRDILELNRRCEKFLLVLNVGGPVDLSDLEEVGNILVLSQLGVDTGTALADIVLGKGNPSGKLTTSWARPEDYCTIGEFGDPDDSDYKEGIYVGYRYFDLADKKPLYPFGYGLSFSSFAHRYLGTKANKDLVTVSCEVTNLGPYAGKQTMQLYVSCPDGKLNKPYQDLAAYRKTRELKANEKEELELVFSMKTLASYDEEKEAYVLEKGDYILRLGEDSVKTVAVAVVTLDEDVVVRKVKNCLGDYGFKDHVFDRKLNDDLDKADKVSVFAKDLVSEKTEYKDDYPIRDDVRKLSEEELAYLNIGAFSEKGGIASVIGDAAKSVAGAAGETCSKTGIKPLVMADGPAGLRISPLYYKDDKGVHSFGPSMPATMLVFMPGFLRFFLGRTPKLKKGVVLKEQYCTAVPIGTAIAQSFNDEFAQICGDIVGREMEIFHIDLWLAPALNIHRSVLCGRNFEYYSEDPLISGKMAAAVTKGVQAHKGKGVTIKHYAANNQETNRYGANANVSERAMREIYLKGFGICIKESAPLALMTSYNLLNGTHTNEHRGLCRDVLRSEFGFDGLIMTDWEVAAMPMGKGKYGAPDPAKCALAGNDLYMPGDKKDWKREVEALRNKDLDRKTLEESASRLYDIVEKVKG